MEVAEGAVRMDALRDGEDRGRARVLRDAKGVLSGRGRRGSTEIAV
jgi:hypothetical protein